MRTYDYVPTIRDDDGNLFFDGVITVEKPSWKIRQSTREKISKLKDISTEAYMMELAEKSVQSISLTVLSTTEEIKSFDDLMDFQEGMFIALQLAEIQTAGVALGKGLQHLLLNK